MSSRALNSEELFHRALTLGLTYEETLSSYESTLSSPRDSGKFLSPMINHHRLYLSTSTDAIDASWVTKENAVRSFASNTTVSLTDIGAIGDSTNDLPFLTIPGLGLISAPSNAQARLKSAIGRLENYVELSSSFVDAFVEFYRTAQSRHVEYIFADKDGVLTSTRMHPRSWKSLATIFRSAGLPGRPFVFVLTGSGYEQSVEFLRVPQISSALIGNPVIRGCPFIILAENGTVAINVLTGKMRVDREMIEYSQLAWLKGAFQREIIALVESEVLPQFGLKWSTSKDHQIESVWMPPKRTMVTFNIPRESKDGLDYRSSKEGERFGTAVLECMVRIAKAAHVDYTIL